MGDNDTYLQFDNDRIRIYAGGGLFLDSNNTYLTSSGILDQDDMSSNSATAVASQQSIKAYVDAEVAGIVNSAPSALNTLDELAAALGDDANFATTTSTSLGNRLRVDTASQGLTGTQQANAITNLGITATKAELNYVDGVTSAIQTQLNAKLTSSSSLNGSNISSGTVAAARIANLAASKITSGTFDAARIAHKSFDIGDTTAETGRSVHETGIYTFNRNSGTLGTGTASGYYSVLAFGQGLGGSAQIAAQWYSGTPNLYFRTLRDTTDDWQDWQRLLTSSDTIDISSQTNLSAGTNISLSGDTLNVDDAFIKNNANDTSSGTITAAGFTTTGNVTTDVLIGNSTNTNKIDLDDDQTAATNMLTITSLNHTNILTDNNNNGTGSFKVFNGSNDVDTADLRFEVTAAGNVNMTGDLDVDGTANFDAIDLDGNLDMRADDVDAARYIHMPRGGGITFYGDASQHHGIFSRNDSNTTAQDDILITSYGAVYIDLDSNNNNTDAASFEIGKHNIANDPIFMVDGETGNITVSGTIDTTSANLTLRRAASDNDRIVIEADQHSFFVNGTKRFEVKGDGTVQVNGTLNATADVVAYFSSDKRLKDNLKPIENSLDKVSKLSGYEFDWNDKQKTYKGHDIGVVAQEVEEVLPELVATREDGYKAVKYEKIVSLLIEAIKELKEEIEELKK
jgi:hypothetical protein